MSNNINKVVAELSNKIAGQMDAHLIESIVSLFNRGVLVHYARSARASFNPDNCQLTVDSASGVMFEGRERIIELEQQLKQRDELIREAHGQNKNLINEIQILKRAYNNICDDLELGEHIDFDWIKESILEQPESIAISSLNTKVSVLSSKLRQRDELLKKSIKEIQNSVDYDSSWIEDQGNILICESEPEYQRYKSHCDFLSKPEIQAIINKEK